MKRIVLVIIGVLAVATNASAQTDAELIERALTAAPGRAAEGASVIKWNNEDHTYTTIKEGTNELVCYDRSSDPGRPAFAVQCTVMGNLERLAQSRQALLENEDGEAVLDMYEANGTRVLPVFGSPWISMNGTDADNARMHTTIAVPNATAESMGLPENPSEGGGWIMASGTTDAHIMVPGR